MASAKVALCGLRTVWCHIGPSLNDSHVTLDAKPSGKAVDAGESGEWDVVHEQLVAVVGYEADIIDDGPHASRHAAVVKRWRNSEEARTLFRRPIML